MVPRCTFKTTSGVILPPPNSRILASQPPTAKSFPSGRARTQATPDTGRSTADVRQSRKRSSVIFQVTSLSSTEPDRPRPVAEQTSSAITVSLCSRSRDVSQLGIRTSQNTTDPSSKPTTMPSIPLPSFSYALRSIAMPIGVSICIGASCMTVSLVLMSRMSKCEGLSPGTTTTCTLLSLPMANGQKPTAGHRMESETLKMEI